MSLFWKQSARGLGDSLSELIPGRMAGLKSPTVTGDTALKHSGVWAGLRLRADTISMLPVDLYRKVSGVQVELPKPKVLVTPGALTVGGPLVSVDEWMWATQFDLDRYGNVFGLIIERDAEMRPSRIDLVPASSVQVVQRGATIEYRIRGKVYDPFDVWHERQYVVPGLPVGLSPIMHAALTIGQYLSAQEFALSWFGGTAYPGGILKNTAKKLTPVEAADAKQKFRESVNSGDVFVTGSDWTYDMQSVPEATAQFIEAQQWSITDGARYIGVPADLIDAESGGSSITYANVTQRNLQFLVMNLGSPIQRRERALSTLSRDGEFVKLGTGALLRMDPLTQAQLMKTQEDGMLLAPSEGRALLDRQPLTPEQLAEFTLLKPQPLAQSKETELAAMVQKIYLGVGTVITEDEARELLKQAGLNLTGSMPAPNQEGTS